MIDDVSEGEGAGLMPLVAESVVDDAAVSPSKDGGAAPKSATGVKQIIWESGLDGNHPYRNPPEAP